MNEIAINRTWSIGCGSFSLLVIVLLTWAAVSELQYRNWLSALDARARTFHGHVYNGRRDSSTHVMISANSHETNDDHVPEIVAMTKECILSASVTNLTVDLSGASISDKSIKELSQMSGLDTLDLRNTGMTQPVVAELRTNLRGTVIKH